MIVERNSKFKTHNLMQTRVKLRKNSTRTTLILSYIFCSLTNGSLPKDCLINMYLFPYCLQYPRQSSNPPYILSRSETNSSYMAWKPTGEWVPPVFRI